MTEIDGEDFIIEKLGRGSVINHNSFLLNDQIDVKGKCASAVTVFYISESDFKAIRKRDKVLDEKVREIEEPLLEKDNCIALDYIISAPSGNNNHIYRPFRDKKEEFRRNLLTVRLKNAVMYYIVKHKEKNRTPKITEVLQQFIEKKKQEIAMKKKQ